MTAEVPECHETFWSNGRLRYRKFSLDGMAHRTDGPAWEDWDHNGRLSYREFDVNGRRHRTDGPAAEWWDTQGRLENRDFWVNGEWMSEKAFLAWQQRQRELAALVFALEHKFPAEAPEREFLRHILPAFVAGEAAT